jgi:[acyl-carrier-protein] S-malonyltransferase
LTRLALRDTTREIWGFLMSIAFVFPGQGSQAVGMGKALADAFPAARAVFSEVDEALSQKLSTLMWEGPDEQLTLTENAQPALMAMSMAALRVLDVEHGITVAGMARCVAGHSLGEYSALAAAGTFTLADTARLLKIRGRAMQAATPVGTGAMAALLGLDFKTASEVAAAAAQGDVCQAANDNSDGQVVVSGSKAAVERALDIAKARGAKRAILLPVSAPFHCALMQPAADVMADALAKATMSDPVVPVVANVVAAPLTDAATIRQKLVEQVTGTVRWRECVYAMSDMGIDVFVEIGAGKVLTGLAKKNAPEAKALAVGAPDDIASALEVLKG